MGYHLCSMTTLENSICSESQCFVAFFLVIYRHYSFHLFTCDDDDGDDDDDDDDKVNHWFPVLNIRHLQQLQSFHKTIYIVLVYELKHAYCTYIN